MLRLRIVPALIGRGRFLYARDLGERRLSLVSPQSFAGGHTVLEYAIER